MIRGRQTGVREGSGGELARLLFLFLVLLCAATCAASGRISSPGGLTVIFGPGDERAAEQILDHAVLKWPAVAAEFGIGPAPEPTIVIAEDDEAFSSFGNGGAPDWGVGCAFVGRGVVLLRSARTVDYPIEMDQVIVHELAHIAAGRALGDLRVPRWFHEGIAMSVAGEWRMERSSALAAAAASGRQIPLSSLEDSFPEGGADAMLAYIESFRAVALMGERSGMGRPGELTAAVAQARDFEAALEGLTGLDSEGFEKALRERLGRTFTWGILLRRPNVYFLLITLLFLVALVVRLRRARLKMKEWDAEERATARRHARGPSGSAWE